MTESGFLAPIRDYYQDRLLAHGPTAKGVDWNSEESQRLRFEQLSRITTGEGAFSVIDYGCGYGALAGYLRGRDWTFSYQGYDISEAMLAEGRRQCSELPSVTFVGSEGSLRAADYVIASGIFNVKLAADDETWWTYVRETLQRLYTLAVRGVAFNALSLYSDPPRRRPDLYYADPLVLFDHCKRHLGPRVALLHDYPLYEFTMLLRK